MKTETLTIMIVDLVGTTPILERSSRDQIVDIVEDATLPIRQAIAAYDGRVVKFTGDGYIAAFRSASESLYAAARIVNAFAPQSTLPLGMRLEGCRVVLHTADVILTADQDGDLIGEGVVIATRLEKHCPPNEIYLTATVRDIAKASEFEFELIGDFPLKGLTHPVKVFRLLTQPFSGVERGICLMLTDLIGMTRFVTEQPVDLVNTTLQKWIRIHRESVAETGGRLRSIVGDNLLTTYPTADQAVDAMLRMATLVNAHNDSPAGLPIFEYSLVLCKGDLFVLNIGINGPLVSHVFRVLEQIPPGLKAIEQTVFDSLTQYRDRFALDPEHPALYNLHVD